MVKELISILMILSVISPAFADRHSSYYEKQSFFVEECDREDGIISIDFSIPVNPESVTGGNIRINGLPLPAEVHFTFNRRGDELLFPELPQWKRKVLCIEIQNLTSNLGNPMIPLAAFHLGPDDGIEWDEMDEVRWCHHYDGAVSNQ